MYKRQEYWLSIGNTLNGNQLGGGSTGMATSRTISGLPTDGRTIYARIESLRGGVWSASYATYTTSPPGTPTPTPVPTGIAQFTSPAPGSTLSSSTVTFTWSPGTGISEYWLSIGTTLNGNQLGGGSTGMATSRTISGLPTGGRTIYARIESLRGGVWYSSYATYTAGP